MNNHTFLPDYEGGSIVNLMSSLIQAFGGVSAYAPLDWLPREILVKKRHVVLIVLDGLGYAYLMRQNAGSLFRTYLQGALTSVFPSTTASAITTFLTGVAPQQHAVTGWFMYLKELGTVATSLLFQARATETTLRNDRVGAEHLYGRRPIFQQMNRAVHSIQHSWLRTTEYNTKINQSPYRHSYRTLAGFIRNIAAIMRSRSGPTFTYAYWSEFDHLCHHFGTASPEVAGHFQALEQQFERLVEIAARTDALLLVTADHGLIDTARQQIVELKHHPALRETLAVPLCGEPRVAYCYVRPAKTAQFERYVTTHFDGVCDLYRSEDLIARNYFGLFEPDPRLFDRVGDYVVIMRDNAVIKEFLPGEEERFHIGNHGGLSREEMLVPLVVIGA